MLNSKQNTHHNSKDCILKFHWSVLSDALLYFDERITIRLSFADLAEHPTNRCKACASILHFPWPDSKIQADLKPYWNYPLTSCDFNNIFTLDKRKETQIRKNFSQCQPMHYYQPIRSSKISQLIHIRTINDRLDLLLDKITIQPFVADIVFSLVSLISILHTWPRYDRQCDQWQLLRNILLSIRQDCRWLPWKPPMELIETIHITLIFLMSIPNLLATLCERSDSLFRISQINE